MRINMAMTEVNGPPEHGAVVVHCSLEFNDEPSSAPQRTDSFEHKFRSAVAACGRAVQDELQRQRQGCVRIACVKPQPLEAELS